jgi:hypothetical protein
VCLIGLRVAGAAPAPTSAPALSLGAKVLAFCQQRKGEQVGNGECAVLAGQALHSAGARRRSPDRPEHGDYVWGDLVVFVQPGPSLPKLEGGKLSDIRPGDIIQFRDAKFEHHTANRHASMHFHHHTAVVLSSQGASVKILQQNFGGDRTVRDATLNLNNLKEGWLRFYRPMPPEGGGDEKQADDDKDLEKPE